jgi:hypothetical protein
MARLKTFVGTCQHHHHEAAAEMPGAKPAGKTCGNSSETTGSQTVVLPITKISSTIAAEPGATWQTGH